MEPATGPTPQEPRINKLTAVFALGLAASAALPLLRDGTSFLELVIEAFGRSVLEGFLLKVGFGSPFLFGLTAAIGILALERSVARRIVRIPVAFMHSQLLLVAITLMTARDSVVAAVALVGLAIVAASRFALHTARTRAEGDGPSLAWYVQWGAVIVAGVAGWMRLQRVVGIELGIGLDVALGCAVAMVVTLGRHRFRAAAPMPAAD